MLGALYVCNTLCSAGQNALGKQYAKGGGVAAVFNLNKAAAGFLLFVILGWIQGFSWHLPTVLLGIGYGISLCISMHAGFKALAMGPMALTSIVASFSLLIPFFFGVCFWKEPVTALSGCGILLLLLSIVFINGWKFGSISRQWFFYALLTLLTNGICSVIQKFHQRRFPTLYRTEFMVFALLSVLVILSVTVCCDRQSRGAFRCSVFGIIAGILNCAANYIVLFLSATENASVLFPIVSVANIAAAWVVGIVFFKEKLTVLQTIGLALGGASIVLLKL